MLELPRPPRDTSESEKAGMPLYEIITEEEVTKKIELAYARMEDFVQAYRKGLLPPDDIITAFLRCVDEHFFQIYEKSTLSVGMIEFRNRKIHELVFPSDPPFRRTWQGMWTRFSDDYQLWKSGNRPCSTLGDAWLTFRALQDLPDGYIYGDEASYKDKERFFRLMEAFLIPVEFFQPAPPETIFDDTRPAHFPSTIIIGFGLWKDDGGLLSDDFQLGSTVELTDHYGLKTTVIITDYLGDYEEMKKRESPFYRPEDYAQLNNRNCSGYVGVGHIEGYTSTRDRKIEISLRDGKIINYLYTTLENDDSEARSNFPLWKEERAYNHRISRIRMGAIKRLLQRFLGEEYQKLGDFGSVL